MYAYCIAWENGGGWRSGAHATRCDKRIGFMQRVRRFQGQMVEDGEGGGVGGWRGWRSGKMAEGGEGGGVGQTQRDALTRITRAHTMAIALIESPHNTHAQTVPLSQAHTQSPPRATDPATKRGRAISLHHKRAISLHHTRALPPASMASMSASVSFERMQSMS